MASPIALGSCGWFVDGEIRPARATRTAQHTRHTTAQLPWVSVSTLQYVRILEHGLLPLSKCCSSRLCDVRQGVSRKDWQCPSSKEGEVCGGGGVVGGRGKEAGAVAYSLC